MRVLRVAAALAAWLVALSIIGVTLFLGYGGSISTQWGDLP